MKGRWFNESILISMLLATVNFYRCVVDCPIQCPAECVPILFKITQAGKNILDEPTPFKKQDMRVEVTPLTPEAPPLLGFDNDAFKLVVCHNGEYKLYLNDTTFITILAKLDTLSLDNCCTYFSASSIKFNGEEICINQNDCGGGTFEIN